MNIKSNASLPRIPFSLILIIFFPGVGEADWAFQTKLDLSRDDLAAKHIDLVFDGLDTYATVKLVGSHLMLFIHFSDFLPRMVQRY